jgi:hypothetical protein
MAWCKAIDLPPTPTNSVQYGATRSVRIILLLSKVDGVHANSTVTQTLFWRLRVHDRHRRMVVVYLSCSELCQHAHINKDNREAARKRTRWGRKNAGERWLWRTTTKTWTNIKTARKYIHPDKRVACVPISRTGRMKVPAYFWDPHPGRSLDKPRNL